MALDKCTLLSYLIYGIKATLKRLRVFLAETDCMRMEENWKTYYYFVKKK